MCLHLKLAWVFIAHAVHYSSVALFCSITSNVGSVVNVFESVVDFLVCFLSD